MTQPHTQNFALAMAEAHVLLGKSLQELERIAGSPQRRSPDAVLLRLQLTAQELRRHFFLEERGGYMAPVLEEAPQFAHAAQELLDEHRHLEESLTALIREASRAQVDDGLWTRVAEWLAQVRRHESRENQIVQEAYNRDAVGRQRTSSRG
jgi:hypothetical protein